jgi:hypothetical protein
LRLPPSCPFPLFSTSVFTHLIHLYQLHSSNSRPDSITTSSKLLICITANQIEHTRSLRPERLRHFEKGQSPIQIQLISS